MLILGISGKRGVGKTTLANYLVRHHGFELLSFAKPLKDFGELMFPGITVAHKERNFMSYSWTPRHFFINLGGFLRYHDDAYWLNKGLSMCSKEDSKYVFDDVRYLNEADTIRSKNGLILRINRFEKNNPYGANLDIPSETDLDTYKFDHVIEDCVNTSLKSLYTEGDIALKQLVGCIGE